MSVTSAATDATNRELTRLEAKINAAEMRVTQLTSLLHESEAENAKLTQLSDALKEEIRRSARNEDREKHMENMEYMKNVILKFMLLGNGEERKHLVPVLKTVLQLSPQETSKLEHIATGEEGDATGKGGWGNYLHLWSNR
ncbi:GRIP and coiled-coil domain-containing protein 2 [Chionoecetes opilio]|uniref:GRIP and coiled-coil domain-containing protein 2 n=1 Tax=Chionoecetes opilio TaxID=41210 RepID=A0A8J5CS05_CHIOP|nr:GRIP and coiled-coil domain-containing protein 2 [Chionoecetes opilio]